MTSDVRPSSIRRRFTSLLLVAAGVGALAAIGPKMPRDHEVALELGSVAPHVTEVELAWSNPRVPTDEATLTTQWHFAPGTAPAKLRARVRLADGAWDASVAIGRADRAETTRWSSRVTLEGTPFWKQDEPSDAPVILPVPERLR